MEENGEIGGAAVLTINENSDNVQISNFGNNSFQITNTGSKVITRVDIDVTDALYPDSVFDPFGVAGDTIARELTITSMGGTGAIDPSTYDPYVGAGGTAGFEGITLLFDQGTAGGFQAGETVGFAVDMDPNSIAGALKRVLDAGTDPFWDVGGVSGAELIGSSFTVTFADGSTASGQLQGNDNQGGSQGLAVQGAKDETVELTVNGLGAGDVGAYGLGGPMVEVQGEAGQTARIVLTKGLIQPTTNAFFGGTQSEQTFAPVLQARLDALAEADFPANNAVEFQTINVLLTGERQDISDMFDFSGVDAFDFEGEDQLPLGFVGSIIDPDNDDLPVGPVTAPIYLQFDQSSVAPMLQDDRVRVVGGDMTVIRGATLRSNDADADTPAGLWFISNVGTDAADGTTLLGGAVSLNAIGNVVYQPPAGFIGIDRFRYELSDPDGNTGIASVSVVVGMPEAEVDGAIRTGGNGANRLTGTALNDSMAGQGGNDMLFGQAGDDVLLGGGGDDRAVGGGGADRLYGGAGSDSLNGSSGADELQGRAQGDLLQGGRGNDALFGGGGNDTLEGGGGRDLLSGGKGRDILRGGDGGDTLEGGGGNDVLVGGTGGDVFLFDAGRDSVRDFAGADGDLLVIDMDALGLTLSEFLAVGTDGSNGAVFDLGVAGRLTIRGETLAEITDHTLSLDAWIMG